MRFLFIALVCLLSVSTLACSAKKQAADDNTKLVQAFLDALNSKNRDTILAFVKDKCSEQLQARADRMVNVSQIGAPFKLVSAEDDGKGGMRAKLEDANGVPVTLSMSITNGKIMMLMLRAGEAAPPKDYSGWTNLATLEENIRSDSGAPAMAVAVLHDGKVEAAASGLREVGKQGNVKADEPFSIGSIGKPVCSTLIGRLIEAGKLRWDETLADALPGVPMKEAYKAVTIEQILHHRGGIPEDPGMRRPDVQRIVNGATDPFKIRDNYSRDILSREPIGKPNEKFAYSNAGYELLGHIAEVAMNKPYETLVKEMIFQPLGMTNSYTGTDTLPSERPSGHMSDDGPQVNANQAPRPDAGKPNWQPANMNGPMEFMFAPAGGGIYCSAGDLVKFGEMHMNGLNGKDGLLKAETIRRLHQGIPEELVANSPGDIKASYEPTEDSRLYACGWGIEARPGIEIMHTHNGSNGTMRAQLAIFPNAHLVVAAFVNCGGESEPSPPLQACLAVAQRFAKK